MANKTGYHTDVAFVVSCIDQGACVLFLRMGSFIIRTCRLDLLRSPSKSLQGTPPVFRALQPPLEPSWCQNTGCTDTHGDSYSSQPQRLGFSALRGGGC